MSKDKDVEMAKHYAEQLKRNISKNAEIYKDRIKKVAKDGKQTRKS